MLGKLIKYENKALSKTLFPLGIGVILVSVFAAVMLKVNLSVTNWLSAENTVATMLQSVSVILFVFAVIAIISACFVAVFMLMQRYYKNLFSDEGYLTFTLPVKIRNIVTSKAVCAFVWSLYIMLCVLVGVFVIAVFGTSRSVANSQVLDFLKNMFKIMVDTDYYGVNIPAYIAQYLFMMIVSFFQQFMLIYLAITMGNQIAKKHKILSSILMYFVIYAVCQTVNTLLLMAAGFAMGGMGVLNELTPNETLFHIILLAATLLSAAYIAIFFFINCKILKNKLNLE